MYILLGSVALAIVLILLTPKPKIEQARKAALGDINFPRAKEGDAIPLVWGTDRIKSPNTLWYGNLRADPVTEEVKTGLTSSDTITTGYTYWISLDLGVCLGPNVALRKLWYGDVDLHVNYTVCDFSQYTDNTTGDVPSNIVTYHSGLNSSAGDVHYDGSSVYPWEGGPNGPGQSTMCWYSGNFSQPQHPAISSYITRQGQIPGLGWEFKYALPGGQIPVDPALTYPFPSYAGIAHIVMKDLQLNSSGQLETINFEVQRLSDVVSPGHGVISRTSTYDPVTNPHPHDADLNPVELLHDLLTSKWGKVGLDTSYIDYDSWAEAAETLFNEQNGISLKVEQTCTVKQIVDEVLRQADAVMYPDLETGKIRIKLLRQDYDVNTLPAFSESDVRPISNFAKTTWESTYNQVRVTFPARNKEYAEAVATAQDMANIAMQGRIRSIDVSFPGVKNSSLASELATRQLNMYSVPLYSCDLEFTRRAGTTLRPGDVFNLSYAPLGIERITLRVQKIDLGDLSKGVVKVTCLQDRFAANSAIFAPPPPTEWTPQDDSASPVAVRSVQEAPNFFHVVAGLTTLVGGSSVGALQCLARRPTDRSLSFKAESSYSAFASDVYNSINKASYVASGRLVNSYSSSAGAENGLDASGSLTIDLFQSSTASKQMGADLGSAATRDELKNGSNLILIGNEILSYQTFTENEDGTFTLSSISRRFLDTPAESHAAGDYVFFFKGRIGLTESTLFQDQSTVSVRLRDQTATELLSASDALVDSVTMDRRAFRPLPPTYLCLDGSRAPTGITAVDTVTVSWRERNRLSGLLAWYDDTTVTPEVGQTNEVEYRIDGGSWSSPVSATGTSTSLSLTGGGSVLDVRVWSKRDGVRSRISDSISTSLVAVWDMLNATKQKISASHPALDRRTVIMVGPSTTAPISGTATVNINNNSESLVFGVKAGFRYPYNDADNQLSYWSSLYPAGCDVAYAYLKVRPQVAPVEPRVFCAANGNLLGSTGAEFSTIVSGTGGTAIAVHSSGNVYFLNGGYIYKKSVGSSTTSPISTAVQRNYTGICVAPNEDVYACVQGGDIYRIAAGTTTVSALGQTSRDWGAMGADDSGNIYAAVILGYIYKRTGGSGNFTAWHSTSRGWSAITTDRAGGIYAAENGGDVYYGASGSSSLAALNQTAIETAWTGLAIAPDGSLWGLSTSRKIYIRPASGGNFVYQRTLTSSSYDLGCAPYTPTYGDYLAIGSNGETQLSIPVDTWANGSPQRLTVTGRIPAQPGTTTTLAIEVSASGNGPGATTSVAFSRIDVAIYAKANNVSEATAQAAVDLVTIPTSTTMLIDNKT